MLGQEHNQHIEVEGLKHFQQILDSLNASQEGELIKRTRGILAKALKKARTDGIDKIGARINNNQRHAEQGLKVRQYSKKSGVIGGNITILRGNRNGHSSPRPIPPTKSGRVREWSKRTADVYGYQGADAQFILWFLTAGTRDRQSGIGRSNRRGEYNNNSRSLARSRYFGGKHNVGRIDPETLRPGLYDILERVVNGEIIPEIDKLYAELGKK